MYSSDAGTTSSVRVEYAAGTTTVLKQASVVVELARTGDADSATRVPAAISVFFISASKILFDIH
jgi:hypothetical protein